MTTQERCPNCHSADTVFDATYGFWQCHTCTFLWAYDADDPDYEELDYGTNEDFIAGQLVMLGMDLLAAYEVARAMVINREPGARSQEPGARSQEPGARSQEPGARSEEPGASRQ